MPDFDVVEAVLKHADIVQVISSYIPVTKKGRSYVALCPFHDDKNPSMQISAEKQIFKCFVCGAGGNAIGFVEKYEKIPFWDAVRKVAQICNYADPRLVENIRKAPEDASLLKLRSCIEDLCAYYRYNLSVPEGEKAREYLVNRELGPEAQNKYSIGYAPKDGAMTIRFLQAKGHSLKSIDDIGVALARGDATADSNAGRVIFPLMDPSGKVVGFSARRIEDDGTAKYVNSPETRLFHKGNVLYNYHRCALSARHDGYCYLVEGFMDVMALDKAGIPNAVAIMGTALTAEQIGLLKRLKCEIRVCLDGDAPGQSAMMKISSALSKAGVPARFVDYQGDLRDPDEILRQEGPEALKQRVNVLVDDTAFQMAYYTRNKVLQSEEQRRKVLVAFLPKLREKQQGIEFEDMLIRISDITGYQAEAIRSLASQKENELPTEEISLTRLSASGRSITRMMSRLEKAERTLLYYMLLSEEAMDFFKKNIGSFQSDSVLSSVAEFLLEFSASHPGKIDLSQLLSFVSSSGIEGSDKVEALLSEVAMQTGLPPLKENDPTLLEDCAQAISEEASALSDKLSAKRAVESGSLEDGAQANKDLAQKIREEWAKKPRKGYKQ